MNTIMHVEADGELARILEAARTMPVRLQTTDGVYVVSREHDELWAGYDPELARAGMASAIGSLTVSDAESLKAAIYRAREEGTRPPGRP